MNSDGCTNALCPSLNDIRICNATWASSDPVCLDRPELLLMGQILFPITIIGHLYLAFAHDLGLRSTRPRWLVINGTCSLLGIVGTSIVFCATTITSESELQTLDGVMGTLALLNTMMIAVLWWKCEVPAKRPDDGDPFADHRALP